MKLRSRSRPRLRTILFIVNLIVLVMPLAGIAGLRIYETELIRRTEAEVLSQAALIKTVYEHILIEELADTGRLEGYGVELPIQWPVNAWDQFRPIPVRLDASRDEIYPPPGVPEPPRGPIEPALARAGQRIEPMLIEAQAMTLSGMRVVDVRGNVVASTQESERGNSVHHNPDVQAALSGEFVALLRERSFMPEQTFLRGLARDTRNRVVVAFPLGYKTGDQEVIVGAVVAWRTPMSLTKGLFENRFIFGGLLGLILLGGLSITALTSFYIGRPIQRLIDHTERVAHGEQSAREPISKPGTFEIQVLSQTVAEMATTLESRADYIKTFARNVSHEFKTPLTSIRGSVELLQDHLDTMEPEERDTFLANLDADAQRLQRLVGRLLELARADVLRPGHDTIDIIPLLKELAASHTRPDQPIVLVDTPASSMALPINITPDAFTSIITNLLVNARQHGAGRIEIELKHTPATVSIFVRDNGPGISAANADKIFGEFFTTARDTGGTGLGLSIVRALLHAHGGNIELIEAAHPTTTGATFRLWLPLA